MTKINQTVPREEEFFNQLLEKTQSVYKKSPVFKKYGNSESWNYAICDTPIQKNKGVFFGLNWGGNDHKAQSKMPENYERNFKLAKHANNYLNKYFDTCLDELNYSNLCFFRTPSAKQLTQKDWQLSLPLFKEYIDFINPPWSIMLGKPTILIKKHITQFKRLEYKPVNGKKRSFAYIGLLFGKYPFGSVPHSAARCSTEARSELWSKVHDELQKLI